MTPTLQHLDGRPQTWEELHRRNEEWYRGICDFEQCRQRSLDDSGFCVVHVTRTMRQVRTAATDRADVYRVAARRIAPYFMTTQTEIMSRNRRMLTAQARRVIWKALMERGWTVDQVGLAAKRDHSTVSHGLNVIERELQTDEHIRRALRALQEELDA